MAEIRASSPAAVASWRPSVPRNGQREPPSVQPQATHVAAHQFAKGDPGYQLQAGDAYFREGPFINDFAEISPDTLFGLGGNNATSFGSFGAPYCKPDSGPIRRYCSVADVR
jgi:hypothetical protein